MAKHVPTDFYVTCATVIPVLFLAIVVQGGTYESMLKAALDGAHKQPQRSRDGAAAVLLPTVAYLTSAAALGGEAIALFVLYRGAEPQAARTLVLITTLILLAVTGAGPAWRWWRVQGEVSTIQARDETSQRDDHAPATPDD